MFWLLLQAVPAAPAPASDGANLALIGALVAGGVTVLTTLGGVIVSIVKASKTEKKVDAAAAASELRGKLHGRVLKKIDIQTNSRLTQSLRQGAATLALLVRMAKRLPDSPEDKEIIEAAIAAHKASLEQLKLAEASGMAVEIEEDAEAREDDGGAGGEEVADE